MSTAVYRGCFLNRELSWLNFNRRVLEQTGFSDTPVLEKLRFLSIFSSNLDEFFMVRVGSLHDQQAVKKPLRDTKTGMTAEEQLNAIYKEMPQLYAQRSEAHRAMLEELGAYGLQCRKISDLSAEERRFVRSYFVRQVLPLLSPVLVDNRHPFPHLENLQSYLVCRAKAHSGAQFGLVLMRDVLDPAVFLPDGKQFVLLPDLFLKYAGLIFKGYRLDQKCIVRVTRNADLEVAEGLFDEETDYRSFMKKLLKTRTKLAPVRLELYGHAARAVESWLRERLGLAARQCLRSQSPLDYRFLRSMEERLPADAAFERLAPVWPHDLKRGEPIIPQIERKDHMLFFPYQSMKPLLNLLSEAAADPNTVSIKICLYRLAQQSQIIAYLCDAAENGVDVTVVLELRARFDERNNINWSNRLEEAGCTVLYGVDDYKVHAKILLITRKCGGEIRTITHIGTGNYNEKTARQYTDLGLLTADPVIGADAVTLFQSLSLSKLDASYRALLPAPTRLKAALLELIREEERKALDGRGGAILLKMNSLTDRDLIEALIRASSHGVSITMLVRGICCLAPGVPGKTENIRVFSIVGRFLEHSRVYVFGAGASARVFIASADWMTRNTERRVELMCPVHDPQLARELLEMLHILFRDRCRMWELLRDGSYRRVTSGDSALEGQLALYEHWKHAGN